MRQNCEAHEIRIIKGVVGKDHVHILVSSPPELAPSEIMRRKLNSAMDKGTKPFSSALDHKKISIYQYVALIFSLKMTNFRNISNSK